jgi:hypothetical protein
MFYSTLEHNMKQRKEETASSLAEEKGVLGEGGREEIAKPGWGQVMGASSTRMSRCV